MFALYIRQAWLLWRTRTLTSSLLLERASESFVSVMSCSIASFMALLAGISPEAPVPVLRRTRETVMPGGAGNVARNLATLGLSTVLIGVVGDDGEGRILAQLLGDFSGIEADLIVMRDRHTTIKTRFVAAGQQLLRVDAEEDARLDASAEQELVAALREEAVKADLILISDYAKGTVSDAVIAAAVDMAEREGIPVIADPKRKDFSDYGAVDVLKPNAGELALATGLPVESDADIEAALSACLDGSEAKSVVVTRAAKGMSFTKSDGAVVHKSGQAREVYDVSGAGDTSIAALALGLAGGGDLDAAVELAIAASGIAVGKSGTATVSGSELRSVLQLGLKGGGVSHIQVETGKTQVEAWREAGLTVGFTNGCFDILHPGHLRVLEEAKARCGRLIVGLNSDASVARLKGPNRPVNSQDARTRVLSGLSVVDAVIVFENDTPRELIEALQPDLLVKGGDYTIDTIVGADTVIRRGGTVHIVPLVDGHSTTATIERGASRMNEVVVHQTAGQLIKQYGNDASTIAMLRAAEIAASGDLEALEHWDAVIVLVDAYLTSQDQRPADQD